MHSHRGHALRRRYGRASAADKTRWDKLHVDYEKKYAAAQDFQIKLRMKYGEGNWRHWASRGDQTKLERLEVARDKVGDKIVTLLVKISPRGEAWLSGVPSWWIQSKLTWEDATRPTNEPLSAETPAAWGYREGLK